MKLSELLHLKNLLATHSAQPIYRSAKQELDKIQYIVSDQHPDIHTHQKSLTLCADNIRNAFDAYERELQALKQDLDAKILEAEKPWFADSYKLYDQEINMETADYILSKRLHVNAETKQILNARLMNYTNWQLPGLIIRPGLEDFIQHMVSYDPLYLVDHSQELLKPAMDQFNSTYQRRLRPYTINEQDPKIFYKMPQAQFGMCFAYGFFNYRPMETIKTYLSEIYSLLRPGGIVIMTFNDCDRAEAVKLVEKRYACYTPGSLIYQLVQSLGYEIIYTYHTGEASTWLELRRPGELSSLRGGQTLAKVIPKPIAESK